MSKGGGKPKNWGPPPWRAWSGSLVLHGRAGQVELGVVDPKEIKIDPQDSRSPPAQLKEKSQAATVEETKKQKEN